MSLTQDQIKNISENLSKIKLNNPKLEGDINGILTYIDLLNEVDTTGVEPTVSVTQKDNVHRVDEEKTKEISREELLGCSNQKVIGDQIAISNIMK